jgi:hypothetical protein
MGPKQPLTIFAEELEVDHQGDETSDTEMKKINENP